MNTKTPNTSDNQEIDLSRHFEKIISIFRGIKNYAFFVLNFYLKHFILSIIVIIVGVVLGVLLDKNNKQYSQKLIIKPNFGSVDYLYGKIELMNSKLAVRDTVFFEKLGFKNAKNLSKIKIEPVLDPYSFVSANANNFDLIKLMAEDSDLEKVVKDKLTSKHYFVHEISFITNGIAKDDEIFDPLMKYFNDSEYYKIVQKNVLENLKIKTEANQSTIEQINSILNSFGQTLSGNNTKSDKLVYYNDNTQLNEILTTKDALIREQAIIRMDLLNSDKIVKLQSSIKNAPKGSLIKLILPFVLFILFGIAGSFIYKLRGKKL